MLKVSGSTTLSFRAMREDDLPEVHRIECAAYEFPWHTDIFQDCLRVGYCCWVGELDGGIVAYGIMSVAVGESHIFNLCVHPDWHGRGLGRAMLRYLLSLALTYKAETAFLEVRASNEAAKALYASEGFCEIGQRRGYYPARGGREDATVLARELAGFESAASGLP